MAGTSCVARFGGPRSTGAEVGRSAMDKTNDGSSSARNAIRDVANRQDEDSEKVISPCLGKRQPSIEEDGEPDDKDTPRPVKQRKRSGEPFSYNNKHFEHSKRQSKTLREQALKTIMSCWNISSKQLTGVPHAPKWAHGIERPFIEPLDWNENLLKALARLALMTRGNFASACAALKDAFECTSRPIRATQLTDCIVDRAIKAVQHDITAPAPTKRREAAVEPESPAHQGVDKSLVTKLPASPQTPTSTAQITKAASNTTLQTPPRSQSTMSDSSGPAAQSKFFGCDDGPLAHEDLLVYRMRLDLCEAELNCRATRARLDEAERLRGDGDSRANELIVS